MKDVQAYEKEAILGLTGHFFPQKLCPKIMETTAMVWTKLHSGLLYCCCCVAYVRIIEGLLYSHAENSVFPKRRQKQAKQLLYIFDCKVMSDMAFMNVLCSICGQANLFLDSEFREIFSQCFI